MTGDFTPDLLALLSADIIISTPEKWDGISRNWQSRKYVMKVIFFSIDVADFFFFFGHPYKFSYLKVTSVSAFCMITIFIFIFLNGSV